MKNKFKTFYQPDIKDAKVSDIIVTDEVLFIFDTNILLNLYRYKEATTKDFFNILKKVKDKTFIPHHVALEYQKNRINVIAEQNKELSKLLDHLDKIKMKGADILNVSSGDINHTYNKVLKKYPSLSNHISEIETSYNSLCKNHLEKLKKDLKNFIDKNTKINSKDKIREELDSLNLKVGDQFEQIRLDSIYKSGEERFKSKIAPGFGDEKEKNGVVFAYNGNMYQQKFGDLIIWEQIKEYLKQDKSVKYVIFVTDDQEKNDWVEKIQHKGLKCVGPKIELVSELLKLNDSIEYFLIFDSLNFVELGGKAFDLQLNDKSVKDIKNNVTDTLEFKIPKISLNKNKSFNKKISEIAEIEITQKDVQNAFLTGLLNGSGQDKNFTNSIRDLRLKNIDDKINIVSNKIKMARSCLENDRFDEEAAEILANNTVILSSLINKKLWLLNDDS